MKQVIIKKENEKKIMDAFKAAQGRATVRSIESFSEIVDICERVDRRLGNMSKNEKNGTVVNFDFRQTFPRAYKYRPESTHFALVFVNGSWRIDLDSIKRKTCPNKNTIYFYTLQLSESAKTAILARYI